MSQETPVAKNIPAMLKALPAQPMTRPHRSSLACIEFAHEHAHQRNPQASGIGKRCNQQR